MFRLKFFRSLDIFAPPYQQRLQDDSFTRTTIAGGLLSVFLLFICIAYASFLTSNYINGKYQPKQNDYTSQTGAQRTLDIPYTYIDVIIYNTQETLIETETRTKVKYFTIKLTVLKDQTVLQTLYAESCYDKNYEQSLGLKQGYYYCFSNNDQNAVISMQADELSSTYFRIDLMYCQTAYLQVGYSCATVDQTNTYLYDPNNRFQISFETDIYDLSKDQYIHTNYTQDIYTRKGEVLNNTFSLLITNMKVIRGLVFQTSDSQKYFYDLTAQNNFFTQNSDPNSLMYPISTTVNLDRAQKYETIQFIPITQVLSEAWTTISLILVLGNIVRIISESSFVQDLMQIQLKFYYKKTAKKLCSQKDDVYITYKDDVSRVVETNEKIQTANYKKNVQNFFNLTKWQKFQVFYLPSFCRKKKQKKTEEVKFLEELIKQTNCEMSLYEMQKELLKMKLLIKLLVTPEQYAAIQMCGCDLLQQPLVQESTQAEDLKKGSNNTSPQNIEMTNLEKTLKLSPTQQKQSSQINQNYDILQNISLNSENDQNSSSLQIDGVNKDNINLKVKENNSPSLKVLPQLNQPLNHLEILNKIDLDPVCKKQYLQQFLTSSKPDPISKSLNQRIKNCMIGLEAPEQLKTVLKLNFENEPKQINLEFNEPNSKDPKKNE